MVNTSQLSWPYIVLSFIDLALCCIFRCLELFKIKRFSGLRYLTPILECTTIALVSRPRLGPKLSSFQSIGGVLEKGQVKNSVFT